MTSELLDWQLVAPHAGADAGIGAALPRRRIILMPAAFQGLAQFRDNGFDTELHARRPGTELVLAAPRMADLNDRRWLPALYQSMIAPARAAGCEVWLGGISLGGFMALRLAAQYPDALDGLCLLAPYLGSRIVAAELERCADPRHWPVNADDQLDPDDDERRIWRYVTRFERPMCRTQFFLGFGDTDRFVDTQRLLARVLPASGVKTRIVAGGHDWPVWRELWQRFLEHWSDVSER